MVSFFKEEIPFFRHIWFFIAGIGIAIKYNVNSASDLPLLYWMFFFLFIILFLIISRLKKLFFLNWIAGVTISLLFTLTGIIWCNSYKEIERKNHFSKVEASHLIAIIEEPPKLKGDIARFPVKVIQSINNQTITATLGKLLLALRFDTLQKPKLQYGDLLLIKAHYSETEQAFNPAEFNYKRFLSYKQIYHQSFINIKDVKLLKSECGNPVLDYSLKFREILVKKFKQYLPDKNAQSVASTLILGDRAELDPEILSAYQNTGTLHVLSVSGMHVMIVVFVLNILFKPLDKFKAGRIVRLIFMLVLIWTYSIVTGLAPSILRAAIMVSVALLSKFSKGKSNSYNVLAIAAFIILLANPYNLMDIGFQLSFLAVLGLIYIHPKLYQLYNPKYKIVDLCWQCICVSLAAQLATTPLSLFYFHQFPTYFLIGNLFMALPATIIMIGGFIFLAIPIDIVQYWLGLFLSYFLNFTNHGLIYIQQLPFSTVNQIWLTVIDLIALYLLLILLIYPNSYKQKQIAICIVSFILFVSFSNKNVKLINQHKTVFFSLRKNTAIAYIKGKSCLLITDLDTNDYTYKFSVKPYLDSCKIKSIKFINPHLTEHENIYSFGDKTLKLLNHRQKTFHKSNADWLLITGNRNYPIAELLECYSFQKLLIDGKNSDYNIRKLTSQADLLNLDYYILKRNFAKEIDH